MRQSNRNQYFILDVNYAPILTTKAKHEKWLKDHADAIVFHTPIKNGRVETRFIGCACQSKPFLWHTTIQSTDVDLNSLFKGAATYEQAYLDHYFAVDFGKKNVHNWAAEGF